MATVLGMLLGIGLGCLVGSVLGSICARFFIWRRNRNRIHRNRP